MKERFLTIFEEEIPARLDALEKAQTSLADWTSRCSLPESEALNWKLMLTEALTNAIRHGCAGHENASILIRFEAGEFELALRVQQPGPGPEIKKGHVASLPEDPLSESGRGLFILQSLADEIHHWHGPEGYRLVMRKRYKTALETPYQKDLASLLNELTSAYESLHAYNRFGQQLLDHSSISTFVSDTITNLKVGHPFKDIRLFPTKLLQASLKLSKQDEKVFGDQIIEWEGEPRQIIWHETEGLPGFLKFAKPVGIESCGMVNPVFCQNMHVFDAVVTFESDDSMSSQSVNLFVSIADLLGISLGVAILQHQRELQVRQQKEWEIATQLQLNLLPIPAKHDEPGFQVSIFHQSAEEIAGDYAIVHKGKANDSKTYLAIIDVMGKGVRAALLAILFRGLFLLMAEEERDPAMILQTLNRLFCRVLGDQIYFITAIVACIDNRKRTIQWANAGHCDLLGVGPGTLKEGKASGPPLGINPSSRYLTEEWALEGLNQLALFTDGCYEWKMDGEFYNLELFKVFIKERRTQSPHGTWQNLMQMINLNSNGSISQDDITLMLCSIGNR